MHVHDKNQRKNIMEKVLITYIATILLAGMTYSAIMPGKYYRINQEKPGLHENDSEGARYIITSKDERDEEILATPLIRPLTPVEGNRSLHPVRILVGESPCNYKKTWYFYTEANRRQISPFELLMNATATIQNQNYYFYDAEDLCIGVDDELNVDLWQYDCSPGGICVCGIYFGYVDIDIAPTIIDHDIHYVQVDGLDRKLLVEDGECKSGLRGHCSLSTSVVALPLMCSGIYNCVQDDTYGPIIVNELTKQTYGICLPGQVIESTEPRNLISENNAVTLSVSLSEVIAYSLSFYYYYFLTY